MNPVKAWITAHIWPVVAGIVILAIIGTGFALWRVYEAGYAAGKAEIEAKVAVATNAAIAGQAAANREAAAAAQRTIEALHGQITDLKTTLEGIDDAAALDADRDINGIGADSVRRLNSVRSRATRSPGGR